MVPVIKAEASSANRRDTGVTKVSHMKVLSFASEAITSVKVSSVHCCFDVNNFSKYKLRRKFEARFCENCWTKHPEKSF